MSGARPSLANTSPHHEPSSSASLPRSVGVISGGDRLVEAERLAIGQVDVVVAADSGLDLALAAGLHVDVAVGDFDSASSGAIAQAKEAGTDIVRFDVDKDETDLELALERAMQLDIDRIVVVGLAGGRPDHALTSLLLLADARWSSVQVRGHVGATRVSVLHGARLHPTPSGSGSRHVFDASAVGDLVSLVPVGGDAEGVTTSGLRWPLCGDTLRANSPRGMSNVVEELDACVDLDAGSLLAFERLPIDGAGNENR